MHTQAHSHAHTTTVLVWVDRFFFNLSLILRNSVILEVFPCSKTTLGSTMRYPKSYSCHLKILKARIHFAGPSFSLWAPFMSFLKSKRMENPTVFFLPTTGGTHPSKFWIWASKGFLEFYRFTIHNFERKLCFQPNVWMSRNPMEKSGTILDVINNSAWS